MGYSRYDSDTVRAFVDTNNLRTASMAERFQQRSIHEKLDPRGVRVRESRDSNENPASTAIAIFGDNTGSMGHLAGDMLVTGVDSVMRQLYEKKPVTDPHLLFGLFGDLTCDRHPLQVSQFECDLRIIEQLQLGFIEGGGGGNNGESGSLPWYFMAHHTATDCWEKRQKKGYLFTYSDEPILDRLDRAQLEHKVMGRGSVIGEVLDSGRLGEIVQQRYHTFHFIVNPGNYRDAQPTWERYLGAGKVFPLQDPSKLPEAIFSLIMMNEGADINQATEGLDAAAAAIIRASIGSFRPGRVLDIAP